MNDPTKKQDQVALLIASAHAMTQAQEEFYCRALEAISSVSTEWRAEAERQRVRAFEAETKIVDLRGKLAATETERDDLRTEMCRLRSKLESNEATIVTLRLREAEREKADG